MGPFEVSAANASKLWAGPTCSQQSSHEVWGIGGSTAWNTVVCGIAGLGSRSSSLPGFRFVTAGLTLPFVLVLVRTANPVRGSMRDLSLVVGSVHTIVSLSLLDSELGRISVSGSFGVLPGIKGETSESPKGFRTSFPEPSNNGFPNSSDRDKVGRLGCLLAGDGKAYGGLFLGVFGTPDFVCSHAKNGEADLSERRSFER